MKIRSLFIYSFLAIGIASCSKTVIEPIIPAADLQSYSITEDFEKGAKTAYATDSITLTTGNWIFSDALLGTLPTDAKTGTKAVRLRNGYISMNFDVSGLTTLYIKHAKFGSDGNSTWQLLASTDGGASYVQQGSDIIESTTTLVTDSFQINTSGKIRFQIKKTGTTRINLDDITFKGLGDPGIIITDPDTIPEGPGTDPNSPGRGTPIAGADAPPPSGDNCNLLMGNPSGAQHAIVMANNYLINQHYYVESYNMAKGEPNWVSWHLDASNITGAASRQNDFAAFTDLPNNWYQVQATSYSGSGFDRGHNCPSADRTSSTDANSSTFLMTNMIPQAPNNNQRTWEGLESYLRSQVAVGNEIYIIMGVYGSGGIGSLGGVTTTIDNGRVNVPSNIWKVAVIMPAGNGDISRVSSSTRVIAVDTPNSEIVNPDWKRYIVAVDDIERATGYNILSNLPKAVQDVIEARKDPVN